MDKKFSELIGAFYYMRQFNKSLENEVLKIRKAWKIQLEEKK